MSVQVVRYLIPDVEQVDWEDTGQSSYLFSDDHIRAFLDVNDGNAKLAAADAVEALATSEALISKVIRTEDLQTDGAKTAQALLARARQLRDSATPDPNAPQDFFEIVPFSTRRCPPVLTEPRTCACLGWCRCR